MSKETQPALKNSLGSHKKAYLTLSDGTEFVGELLGTEGFSVGEMIFNTAMTGYQEIITDNSYAKQLICFTYPHIGNVGVNDFDNESSQIAASGIIIRDYCADYSNWRAKSSLNDWLIKNKTIGISGVDTRQITKMIRTKGAMGAVIYASGYESEAKKALKDFKGLTDCDLAKVVSTRKSYPFNHGLVDLANPNINPIIKKTAFKVAVLDFGVKTQILRILADLGCDITVYPAETNFQTLEEEGKKENFDGIFLSNGPGDPAPCDYAITLIKKLLEIKIPIFGICLGHQLLALALGAKSEKMRIGHHGANHPVQCLKTKKVLITSQNHGFCVAENLPSELAITHRSLFDNTIQGIEHKHLPAYGFQGHPEASPGPHDARKLFTRFINDMKQFQKSKNSKK